ncbi:MAG: hypothetical protein AAFQ11_12890 [Pseudomonadota bacterium]
MNLQFRVGGVTRFAEGLARRVLPRVLARASDQHRQRQNQQRRDDVLLQRMREVHHRRSRRNPGGA